MYNSTNASQEGRFSPARQLKTKKAEIYRGNAATDALGFQSVEKIVHFAECHEEPPTKDTRDNYRNTPAKEPRTLVRDRREEYVIVKSNMADGYVKIPMESFRSYVTDYVKKIVESALESIASDESQGIDVPDAKMDVGSVDSDDGIEIDCAEEDALISLMVDEMLARVVQSLADERATELTLPRESKSADSDVSWSTNTGASVATSLEWDGYEALLLREDPSATDISIAYPEISAGMDV